MKKFIKQLKKAWRKYFVSRSVARATYEGETMTVTWDDGTTTKYEGSCTVWYEHPYMERCSTSTEILLCDLWSYIKKWEGSYPDAHKHCG